MLNKSTILKIRSLNYDIDYFNKLIVSAFVKTNNINVTNNKLILSFLNKTNSSELEEFICIIQNDIKVFKLEVLIYLFELTIPLTKRVSNGVVYTPDFIKNYIIQRTLNKSDNIELSNIKIADISCGSGAFLLAASEIIKEKTGKSYIEIFKENIFGLDIDSYACHYTKIVLSLLAISQGEDEEYFHFNIFNGNALCFDWKKKILNFEGFNIIVGNPPYVRAKNLESTTKKLMENWVVSKSGNPDLYIPFFEVGIKYLHKNGVLGYITPNTFKKSVNARKLREYLQKNLFDIEILDFGASKVFEGKLTYTCIVFIQLKSSQVVKYVRTDPHIIKLNKNIEFSHINFNQLNAHDGWLLADNKTLQNIYTIENTGTPLGKLFPIKNGLATLCNDVFIFTPFKKDENYYYLFRDDSEYKIEKQVCREIIKPNKLKTEKQIENIKEQIIFPYYASSNKKLSVLEEELFKEKFPYAYNYLKNYKNKLLERDKGKNKKYQWYEFGRSQALNIYGKKLFFPYISSAPYFVYSDQEDLLFYAGYAIIGKSTRELKILKKILESEVFWYYIKSVSKPYSSGYYALAKNYIKNFGICDLFEDEEEFLLNTRSKQDINKFLIKKYNIDI